MADQHRLVDGAGVVIQSASNGEVCHDHPGRPQRRAGEQTVKCFETFIERGIYDVEPGGKIAYLGANAIGPRDLCQREARFDLGIGGP